MTISVRSRIFVTTPDGRSHTGVVTGLRGQGMADLLLDDGRAIRQPVSALRPALARTNGRHARYNPRARRNTGDVYDQVAAVLVDPSRAKTVKDRSMGGLTVGDEKVDELVSDIKGRLAARGSRLGRAAAWAQGYPATVEEIAEALRAYGARLPSQFDSYLSGLQGLPRGAYTPRDPDAERDLLLLYALHDTVFRGPPASAVKPGAAVTPDAAYIDAARLLLSGKNKLPSFTDGQLEALTGERVQPAAYVQLIRERLLQDFAGEGSAVYKIPRPALDALLTSSEEAAKGAAQEKLRAATDKFSRAEGVEDRVAADKERKEAADKLKKLLASYEKVERERRDARFDQAKRELARVDGQADTVEALAADLQAAFGTLPAEVERNLQSSEGLLRDAAVSTEDTRKLFLLRELRSLMTPQATKETATAASAAERARREKAELRAESVRVGRREDRTAENRQSSELAKQIGGVDLKTFTETEKIAYSIIPDPLRETRDKSYFCGNALDGYAYTVATTTQTRTVRHWLTWRDLGILERGATAPPLFTALVTARRGEKATASLLTVKHLAALVAENQPLALAYDRVPVTVNTTPKGKRPNTLILTRTPVSRFLTGGGVYNEFEVNVVSDVPDAVVADMSKEGSGSMPMFTVVDIQPALQRVRAGSQTGSLYPRRPMPPKSPTPGWFDPDAPVLLTPYSGYHGAPDVFGFSVVREVETATALFDDFKPYPGYSYKDRNPYFSWQPEAAGQFSAMVTGTGERPCANPDMVAQLNALRKAHYTILAVVRAATRVNEVLTREDGVNTLSDERGVNAIVRAMEGVVKALVRITRLQQSITDERLIQGARLSSTSDFSVFANPERFIAAVTPAEPNGEDIAKLSRLAADITTTKDLVEQLSREAANFQLVQQVRVPTKNDPDRIDVVPADIERLLSAMASNTSALVNVKRAGPVSVYSVAPAYKNEPRAPFVVVAGALCESAPLADVVASLVPDIAQLALLDVPATTLGEALENQPLASAEAMLRTARRGTHRPSPSERVNLKLWWGRVRSLLADMYAPHAFRGQRVLSAKFVGLVDFLIARELIALEGGAPWDEWDGVTSPIAAISLSIFASTFLGDPKVGGLLAHAPLAPAARINAGRGSTETDDMVKRAEERGYSVGKQLTPEEKALNKELRLRQQNMTRTDTQPISYELGKASQEKAEKTVRARVAEQSAAKVSGATIESIAQSLQASMEYAQRSLVGGGQVSETEKGVRLHYTYNPLLFQLLRLYYHQDKGPKEQEPVLVAAAPTANPNPSPERTRDIYTEAAEALALAADKRLPDPGVFALSVPVFSGPAPSTAQLVAQIAARMAQHPKSYKKSLSRLNGTQGPLVPVANELQKALPRVQDILNFYRSRIEGLAQEGKITSDASADQKALLLFAVYEALAKPPETPARAPYTKASFSVEASASRAPLKVKLPEQLPKQDRPPDSPLLKARQGDVFTAPEQAQNLFRGFSQETEGADRKTTHKTINKKMLRLIDWVGVYGSLLDLVRRSVLAYKREQGSAPLGWDQVHDGWLLFMGPKVKNSNSTLSDIPQLWLDLCPMDEDGKSWAARYRAMTEDETGDTIKSTVLWAKGYAARGLSYAGELARRGFGEAKFAHEAFAVPLRADEDVFLRRGGTAVENDTLSALRKLLQRNAKALHALEKDAKRVDPRQNWSNIEDGASTTQLIALSVSPLAHARLLTEDQLRALVEALILPQTAPDSPLAFREDVILPYTLFRAYVNALMQLRVQTENLEPPTYPTAPKGKAVSLIRPTAAAMVAEPADSFLGISQDRENMRRLLLRLVTEKQVALAVDYKTAPRGPSSSSP